MYVSKEEVVQVLSSNAKKTDDITEVNYLIEAMYLRLQFLFSRIFPSELEEKILDEKQKECFAGEVVNLFTGMIDPLHLENFPNISNTIQFMTAHALNRGFNITSDQLKTMDNDDLTQIILNSKLNDLFKLPDVELDNNFSTTQVREKVNSNLLKKLFFNSRN